MQTSESATPIDSPANTVENEAYWKHHFEQFKLSRMTKAAYARHHTLVLHRFMYWSRKFEALESSVTDASQGDFIPIHLRSRGRRDVSQPPVLCTIEFTNGHRLLFHEELALTTCLSVWR